MAAPSGCRQSATQPTAILPSAGARLRKSSQLILDVKLCRDREIGDEPFAKIGEPVLRSLQELDKVLDEWRVSSSSSQDKPNESESAPGIAFQDLVEPVPKLIVSIYLPLHYVENDDLGFFADPLFAPWEDVFTTFPGALLELVLKFRTKLHLAFDTSYLYAKLLRIAIVCESLELAKHVVAMEPHQVLNNRCLSSATVVAKVIKCASMLEFITFLFEICHYPSSVDFWKLDFNYWFDYGRNKGRGGHYEDLFFKYIGTLPFSRKLYLLLSVAAHIRGDICETQEEWYGNDIKKSHLQIQKLPGVWNLTAEVHGLDVQRAWSKDVNPQTLKLQVSLQPVVVGACSMAIGV